MNGGPRRLLWAIVAALTIVNAFGVALETANGAGATYRWRQCHLFNRGASEEVGSRQWWLRILDKVLHRQSTTGPTS